MANKFLNYAEEVLKTAKVPLIVNEIWEEGKRLGIDKKITFGKTPVASLGSQLYVDTRDNDSNSIFKKYGKRPARFFLKTRTSEVKEHSFEQFDSSPNELDNKQEKYSEKDLHPVLSYYVNKVISFNHSKAIYTKTILHEKSSKTGYSEWVYPDIVGFYLPVNDWEPEILELNKVVDKSVIKFYSFELKKYIGRNNYREAFFQAVSNSSWAHESYLVCADLNEDEDLFSEIERLSMSFGVGIIKLDLEDVDSSKVLFQARIKDSLDWETMNKLCDENPDFKKFIADVKIDFESKRIHQSEYDKVPDDVENYVKRIIKR